MKILIVGSGAREHALAWKLRQSPRVSALFAAPGNAGTAQLGTNWPDLPATGAPGLAARAGQEKIDLAVIGPEAALAAGVGDALRDAGIAVFGPGRKGARLESSKAFAKQFMVRHGVPTARFRVAHDRKQALRHLREWEGAVVLKADGLAAGKGVVVCDTPEQAAEILGRWFGREGVPGGGSSIVLEERLAGREVSVLAITDGAAVRLLEPACDYKRACDGDTGPNTGGMGAYSPAPDVLDGGAMRRIVDEIIEPVRRGLTADGIEYRGCLYAGLMITQRGPRVLEFNARFGDPETQVLMPRLTSDLCETLHAAARGELGSAPYPQFSQTSCVAVVLTDEGYPSTSAPVKRLPLSEPVEKARGVVAFWGASVLAGGSVDAAGGRVLTMTALGGDLAEARVRAYQACKEYAASLDPGTKLAWRTDIAARAVAPITAVSLTALPIFREG